MPAPRNNAITTRGRPFQRGNPGRPKGSRHRATLAAESLLDGEAEALTRKAVELALEGDMAALRLCLERILPPRRDRPVSIALPPLGAAADAVGAMAAITTAVADGGLTPSEAGELAALVSAYVKAIEVSELERRMAALEERSGSDPTR
jgi:hypothetical protein